MVAFAQLGENVVVKPLFGAEGRGLLRIDDENLAWRTFRTLARQAAVLAQGHAELLCVLVNAGHLYLEEAP